MGPADSTTSNRTTALLAGILLAALTAAAFAPLLGASFVSFDDHVYITENPRALSGLTWDGVIWAFSNIDFGFYYPLTWISHMLDCQMFGLWAPGHHLTSIVIHILNATLLLYLLWEATGALWRSWMVSALFALHPMHVESVAWISERKDVLSTLFLFLALVAYGRYAKRPSAARYASVAALLLLGLMTKTMLVTAPALMLLWDVWPLGRFAQASKPAPGSGPRERWQALAPTLRRLVMEKLPLAVLCVGFGIVTLVAQSRGGAVSSIQTLTPGGRVACTLVGYATYLSKLVAPVDLAVLYPLPPHGWPIAKVVLSFALLALVTLLALRLGRSRPYWAVGWGWFLVAIAPVSGLLQVGGQAYADRYTYVAYIGLFIPLVWSGAEMAERLRIRRWAVAAGCSLLLLALGAGTRHQCGYWKDGVTLFTHSLQAGGMNCGMLNSLGLTYAQEGKPDKAVPLLQEATLMDSRNASAWGNLGNAYRDLGKLPEAEACYQRVLTLEPRDGKALNGIGFLKEMRGDLAGAATLYREAVEVAPSNPTARVNFGRVLAQEGKDEAAYAEFRRASELNPNWAQSWYYLGMILERSGKPLEAEADYRKAAALAPENTAARLRLAGLLERSGRYAEAGQIYGDVLRLEPRNAAAAAGVARASGKGIAGGIR